MLMMNPQVLWIGVAATFFGALSCGELATEEDDTAEKTDSETADDTTGDTSADAGADTDTDVDTDTDTDTDTDVDTDSDTDVDTDTDGDADGGPENDTETNDDDIDTEPTLDCFYSGETHSGEVSEREWGGADGSCGFTAEVLPTYYVTVSKDLFDDAAACGNCMHIHNAANGLALDAMVVDQCPSGSETTCGVAMDDLALNPAAATALGVGEDGATVDWNWAPCDSAGFDTLRFHFKNDTNPSWFAVQILNHRNAVARVEINVDGEWKDAGRQNWNYWVIENCCGEGPFDIRVTDIFGNVLTASDIPFSPDQIIEGPGQFPPCEGNTDTDILEPDTSTESDPSLSEGQDAALRVSSPPIIDGTPHESLWRLNTAVTRTASGTPNNTANMDAVWDNTYLYVAAEVKDDIVCVGVDTNSWWYDSVEVYIDPDNSKMSCDTAQEPYHCYDDMDVQISIKYTDDPTWHEFGDNTQNRDLTYEAAGAGTADGYTIEARIPWAGLGLNPQPDMVIGFDIGVNDNDMTDCTGVNESSRSGEMRWQGDGENYQTTVNFGELVLFSRAIN